MPPQVAEPTDLPPHPANSYPSSPNSATSSPPKALAKGNRGRNKMGHGERYKIASEDRALTRPESVFIDAILLGWPYHRAYTTATGSNAKKNSCEVMAWHWLRRPAVQRVLAERRQALDERMAATRTEKRVVLANILRDPAVPALARIGAIQVDNRMTGDDEPKKTTAAGGALVFSVDPMRDVRRAESIPIANTPKLAE